MARNLIGFLDAFKAGKACEAPGLTTLLGKFVRDGLLRHIARYLGLLPRGRIDGFSRLRLSKVLLVAPIASAF
jgi:hypothetical protein